jgi:phosphoenolpyruvate carboxylase
MMNFRIKRLLLKIAGHKELMENYPDGKASIQIRERIVFVNNTAICFIENKRINKESAPDENLIKSTKK